MAKIIIKLSVVEWDIGGKEDRSRYEANCEIVEEGKTIVLAGYPFDRYVFMIKEISETSIRLSCNCPLLSFALTKNEPFTKEYNIEGFEDHDGCVWNGEDEYLYVLWSD